MVCVRCAALLVQGVWEQSKSSLSKAPNAIGEMHTEQADESQRDYTRLWVGIVTINSYPTLGIHPVPCYLCCIVAQKTV